MIVGLSRFRAVRHALTRHALLLACLPFASLAAQQLTTDTRDPNQKQDTTFAKSYQEWLANPKHGSPLVDHLPVVAGIPTPRDVLGYHIGAPRKLTYYADQLKYYRALAAASPRGGLPPSNHFRAMETLRLSRLPMVLAKSLFTSSQNRFC